MEKQFDKKTELEKALEAGFIDAYFFNEGHLENVTIPEKRVFPKDIQIDPRPCPIDEQIVYRLILPDGTKGFAITQDNSPD